MIILRVGVLMQEGRSSICLVKSISSQGAQIRFYARPVVDADASIRVADELAVNGRVAWLKDDIAGLTFDEELDPQALLRVRQKIGSPRQRALPRVGVEAAALLRSNGRVCRATVCDISSVGARVRTRSPLAAGDRAIVTLAGLPPMTAFVRWAEGEESGLSFEAPIPMPIIADWIGTTVRLTA